METSKDKQREEAVRKSAGLSLSGHSLGVGEIVRIAGWKKRLVRLADL